MSAASAVAAAAKRWGGATLYVGEMRIARCGQCDGEGLIFFTWKGVRTVRECPSWKRCPAISVTQVKR
jgi:hypothetical protein